MNSGELYASAQETIVPEQVQPTPAGLFGFLGGTLHWIGTLGPNVRSIPLDTLVSTVEQLYDATFGAYNFPEIPDIFEMPLKAYVRSLIRPLISQAYAGLTGES